MTSTLLRMSQLTCPTRVETWRPGVLLAWRRAARHLDFQGCWNLPWSQTPRGSSIHRRQVQQLLLLHPRYDDEFGEGVVRPIYGSTATLPNRDMGRDEATALNKEIMCWYFVEAVVALHHFTSPELRETRVVAFGTRQSLIGKVHLPFWNSIQHPRHPVGTGVSMKLDGAGVDE